MRKKAASKRRPNKRTISQIGIDFLSLEAIETSLTEALDVG
jgi:hypothetical protein